jgi:hypothetical protein
MSLWPRSRGLPGVTATATVGIEVTKLDSAIDRAAKFDEPGGDTLE